jgi:hypothetical protein
MSEEFEQNTNETNATNGANETSRRNFLKVAVVSSAAAAAAVGTAGVAASAIASSGHAPSGLAKLLSVNTDVVSTTDACVTHTTEPFVQDTVGDPINGNASLFVWAWFTLGGAGTYTASISVPSGVTPQNSSNDQIAAYGGESVGCPTEDPGTHGFTPLNSGSAGGAPGYSISFTGTAGDTVVIKYHMNATSVADGTYPVSIELVGPGGYDHTHSASLIIG